MKKTMKLLVFMLIYISLFNGRMNAFAEGDGTGGGKTDPLVLVSSSIKDGAAGVEYKPQILLTFSKNIINMSVRENNLKCFSMKSKSGTAIPVTVTLADDQVDFEKRNDAIVTPTANLSPATTYSVVVSSSLTSKSGVTTGKIITVSFTTKPEKTAADPVAAATVTSKSKTTETAAAQGGTTQKRTASTTNTTTSTKTVKSNTSTSTESTTGNKQAAVETKIDSGQPKTEHASSGTKENNPQQEVKSVKTKPYEAASPVSGSDAKGSNSNNVFHVYIILLTLFVIAAGFIYYDHKRKLKKARTSS